MTLAMALQRYQLHLVGTAEEVNFIKLKSLKVLAL